MRAVLLCHWQASVLTLPLVIFGLLMKLDLLVMLLSVIWPVALVIGFLMAMLLVGLFFGWPLMWATVGVESTDAFDSLSRAYSYVFHRPLRLLFYVIVAVCCWAYLHGSSFRFFEPGQLLIVGIS